MQSSNVNDTLAAVSSTLGFTFSSRESKAQALEALIFTISDCSNKPEGNAALAALGASSAAAAQMTKIVLANANGTGSSYNEKRTSGIMEKVYSRRNLARVFRGQGLDAYVTIRVPTSTTSCGIGYHEDPTHVDDEMAGTAMNSLLGAVELAGGRDQLAGMLNRLGLMH